MKAIRFHQFGDPEVMKLEDVPVADPAPNQVVVDNKASGINPVDTYIRAGLYGPRPLPMTPGFDGAGVVDKVGAQVKSVKPGDRVYVFGAAGAYAQKITVDASHVRRLPEPVTFAQGAALGVPYATAYWALFGRGEAKEGETVLVHGASGGVGLATVQFARARGLTVIGTAGTDQGRDLVRREGAHHVLDHHAGDFERQLLALTGDQGPNLIIEMLSNVNLGKDLKLVGPKGRIVTVGSRGKVEIDPRDMFLKQSDVRGMSLMTVPEIELAAIHQAIEAGLENRTLRPVIGQQLPLADAAKAHRAVMEAGAHGKIILVP